MLQIFIPIQWLLTEIGKRKGIAHGIRSIDEFNNLAFTDDLTIVVEIRRLGETSGGDQTLPDVIEMFSDWIGMEVKIVKSSGMWVGLRKKDDRLDLQITFRDHPLKIVAKETPVRYLGFYQSPDDCWKNMVTRVIEESRKACSKLEQHPLSVDEVTDLEQVIVISVFRRPAALVPWSMQELNRMDQLYKRHSNRCDTSCAVLVSMSLCFPPTQGACNAPDHYRLSGRRQLDTLRGLYVP